MLKVLYGEMGAGKTKAIIQLANDRLESAKGTVVYIDDDKSHSREINYQIRFIDASEYSIDSPKMFFGFLSGIAAQDFDLEAIYVDGFKKIVRHDLSELEALFSEVESFSQKFNIDITISINGLAADMPEYLKKYV